MITTDFSTHCCKSATFEAGAIQRRLRRWVSGWWGLVLVLLMALSPGQCLAVAPRLPGADGAALRLERAESSLWLSASMQFVLPELVKDALYKGIPMYFVAEAQVLRHRWYWSDVQVSAVARYWKLSYQPLTRRWRLMSSSEPLVHTGLGVTLGQTFDELSDAVAALQRLARWRIASTDALLADAQYTVNFRFRLDISQLPRPFQIGAVGRSDWSLLVVKSQAWPPEVAP